MAVPKKKVSRSRRDKRRSHHALVAADAERMPELRRNQASAPRVRGMRFLQRPRDHGARGQFLTAGLYGLELRV